MASQGPGVTITLREIYDALTELGERVGALERQLNGGSPAYLKQAGYALGLLAAGAAAGWGALRGGG